MKICPVMKTECVENDCAWWSARSWQRIRDHAQPGVCAALEIASNLERIDAGIEVVEEDLDRLAIDADSVTVSIYEPVRE